MITRGTPILGNPIYCNGDVNDNGDPCLIKSDSSRRKLGLWTLHNSFPHASHIVVPFLKIKFGEISILVDCFQTHGGFLKLGSHTTIGFKTKIENLGWFGGTTMTSETWIFITSFCGPYVGWRMKSPTSHLWKSLKNTAGWPCYPTLADSWGLSLWRKVKGFLNCSGQFHGIKNHFVLLGVKHQTYGAITDNAWVMIIWGYYMLLPSFTIQYIGHDHNPLGNPFRIGWRSHFEGAQANCTLNHRRHMNPPNERSQCSTLTPYKPPKIENTIQTCSMGNFFRSLPKMEEKQGVL